MSVTRLVYLLVVPLGLATAQQSDNKLTPEQVESRLHYLSGRIALRSGLASLDMPSSFRYLDAQETETVLRTWGNPPGSKTLGMLVPAGISVFDPASWAVVITYDEDGYVKDDEAAKIDYADLLAQMQRGARDENQERKKAGYPPVELVGWAEPPHYDSASHTLYWAKDLRFGTDTIHTLNYNIRVLGRRGVLVLNAVATMDQLGSVKNDMTNVIGFVDFNDGHRYTDFVAGDKVAEYGIAALIAGGVAAKAGLFKVLLGALIALKKLIVVALVAVAAFLRRLFRRKPADAPAK